MFHDIHWGNLGTFLGGTAGFLTLLLGAARIIVKWISTHISEALTKCERDKAELQVTVSALQTELVYLRKMLPGGDWATKLGLYPNTPVEGHLE